MEESCKPKLIIFDLDDTLWPFHVDWTITGPLHPKKDGIYDATGQKLLPYPDVPEILERLNKEGYAMAAASRTTMPKYAEQLLKYYDWNKYFPYKEIYPSTKIKHFASIHELSGIPYRNMLFFDDEYRNIKDLTPIGVTCVYIEGGGLTKKVLEKGLKKHGEKIVSLRQNQHPT